MMFTEALGVFVWKLVVAVTIVRTAAATKTSHSGHVLPWSYSSDLCTVSFDEIATSKFSGPGENGSGSRARRSRDSALHRVIKLQSHCNFHRPNNAGRSEASCRSLNRSATLLLGWGHKQMDILRVSVRYWIQMSHDRVGFFWDVNKLADIMLS